MLRCYLFLKTAAEFGVRVRRHDIPHLCLSHRVAQSVCCLIVRMDLNGQLLLCINELYKQGEDVAEALVVFLTYQFALQLCYQVIKFCACVFTIADDGLVVFNT